MISFEQLQEIETQIIEMVQRYGEEDEELKTKWSQKVKEIEREREGRQRNCLGGVGMNIQHLEKSGGGDTFISSLSSLVAKTYPILKSPSISKAPTIQKLQSIRKPLFSKDNSGCVYIESYITALGYNFIAEPFWTIKKTYSVHRLSRMAQDMVAHGLPIKCLEAVVLGIHLTTGMEVDRVSKWNKRIY